MSSISFKQLTEDYDVVFLDCDGVVLDSNRLKTEAFREVALPYGTDVADRFVAFHQENGGISRYEKFASLFKVILGRENYDDSCREAIAAYADIVSRGLLNCAEVPGLRKVLEALAGRSVPVFVVSGSDQAELRNVFRQRGLDIYFRDVLGSPRPKGELIESALQSLQTSQPERVLLCGDSRVDYQVANRFGFDFVMVYGCSEWADWNRALPPELPRIPDFAALA